MVLPDGPKHHTNDPIKQLNQTPNNNKFFITYDLTSGDPTFRI
jgi:hypothetical protein